MRLLTTTALVAAFASPTLASEVELGFAHIGLYKTGINSATEDAGTDAKRVDVGAGINVRGFRAELSFIHDEFTGTSGPGESTNAMLSFGSNFTDQFALGYYLSKTNIKATGLDRSVDELGVVSTLRIKNIFGKASVGGVRINDGDFQTTFGIEAGYATAFGLDVSIGAVRYGDDTNILKAAFAYQIANSGLSVEGAVFSSDEKGSTTKGESAYIGLKYNFGSKKRQFAPIVHYTDVRLTSPNAL
jgi:hypothetical protein